MLSKTMREMMCQKMLNPQRDTKWEKTKETEDCPACQEAFGEVAEKQQKVSQAISICSRSSGYQGRNPKWAGKLSWRT